MTPTLSPRQRRIARWSALPVAVLASGVIVSTASYAAFTATTSNDDNTWSAGSITLTDDDADSAMFTATDLQPGATGTGCITVTSTSSLASTVTMYTDNAAQTSGLADHIDLVVEQGTAGSAADCSDFAVAGTVFTGPLSTLTTTATDHASGVGEWEPGTGSHDRSFRIRYTLADDAPNTTQGGTASVDIVWEAQTD